MDLRIENQAVECPTTAIAAYVDGELDAVRELELELHLAGCDRCTEELNLQKQFLCSLNSSLMGGDEIELPPNFTKQIVTNAESSVSGLRKPNERFNALFICAALLLFVLFALGSDVFGLFGQFGDTLDKIAAVGGFLGHVAYSFLVGIGVVLRSLGGQFQVPAAAGFFLLAVAGLIFFQFSRVILRIRRT